MDQVTQAIYAAFIFAVLFACYAYLSQPEYDGGLTRWQRLWTWFGDRYLTPTTANPARTGAGIEVRGVSHQNAVARSEDSACVRAESVIPAEVFTLAPDELVAVQRMIAHNKTLAKPNKLATIQAGWPTIKNRSGDPKSLYARASAIYDALFTIDPEARYPTLAAERVKARQQVQIAE